MKSGHLVASLRRLENSRSVGDVIMAMQTRGVWARRSPRSQRGSTRSLSSKGGQRETADMGLLNAASARCASQPLVFADVPAQTFVHKRPGDRPSKRDAFAGELLTLRLAPAAAHGETSMTASSQALVAVRPDRAALKASYRTVNLHQARRPAIDKCGSGAKLCSASENCSTLLTS
jgi:hypothetical protein